MGEKRQKCNECFQKMRSQVFLAWRSCPLIDVAEIYFLEGHFGCLGNCQSSLIVLSILMTQSACFGRCAVSSVETRFLLTSLKDRTICEILYLFQTERQMYAYTSEIWTHLCMWLTPYTWFRIIFSLFLLSRSSNRAAWKFCMYLPH